jgi:signal transduction histidine kinase
MLLLVGSINAINFYQMEHKVKGTLQVLSENQGKFPKFDHEKPPQKDPKFGFRMNEETPFETRYFTVKVNNEGSIQEIDTSHIAAVSSEDAVEYVDKVEKENETRGYLGIYKYAVVEQTSGTMIIFIDCRSQIQTITFFLLISCAVALATLLLVFLLVSIFSKRAMKPIVESMEKQKQFITDAGHEIKTPLAIISANADVLELTGGNNEWITSIRNQTSRLDKLVKHLLTLSKMEEGRIELVFTNFNLSEAITEIAESFRAMAEATNKKFYIEVAQGLTLNGDKSSIHQLVSTLLDNAMKYSDQEGTITITVSAAKKGIMLEVYNTVQEIDRSNLNRLFDRFYRADSSRSRETGGYGIGLSIAKSIVEAHHGKITVRSDDSKSICFTVII